MNKIIELLKKENIKFDILNFKNIELNDVSNDLKNENDGCLLWISDSNISNIENITNGIVICSNKVLEYNINNLLSIIIVEKPRYVFSKVISEIFSKKRTHKIEIDLENNTNIYENVNIGRGTIIEENVKIGKNTFIGYNNVILENTIIGDNVVIGNNNTIGGVGFGYEKNESGEYELIPHIGNVIIEDNVEIGSNNCIDRAVLGSTILRKNCKIDNLVHIAHGVDIGENSLIIANSMIAGSVKIGENTRIAPSTSIINKSSVGSNSMTGIGTVVIKNIPDNELHIGVPSKKLKNI